MEDAALLSTLRDLELRLLRPEVRSDPLQLGALLHRDFVEIGAGGKVYTRDEVLAEFRGSPPKYSIWAQDFAVQTVASGVALLRYRSAHIERGDVLSRHVARTSLWQYAGGQWWLRFHQGTATAPFEKHPT
jgi:hypothetical protein